MLMDPGLRNERAQQASALSIAVFCSSAPGTPVAESLARDVGRQLGEGAHALVYGGDGSGLMGEVVRTAHAHGSQIFGVIPMPLYERGLGIAGPSKVVRITKTFSQRKDVMCAMADAFIALPGGLDTCADVLDVISLSYLGLNQKPIALIETCGEWQPMLDLLGRIAQDCLEGPPVDRLLRVAPSAAEALKFVMSFSADR